MFYSNSSSQKTKQIALVFFIFVTLSRLFAQYRATSNASHDATPRTDVYAIFSIPPDERSWPALDSLGVGWVRLQNQMGESNQQLAIQFFSRVLSEGYGLWLTLGHRDRSNVADTTRFDASSRGSFPPADSLKYKELVRSNIQPLVDLLASQGKDPRRWLVVQFANEVAPEDVLPPSPIRFFHGTSDEYLETLALTSRAVKSVDPSIPVAFGGISSRTLEVILEFERTGDPQLQGIVSWNERLLREAVADWADIHLYHRLESIPDKVAWVRARWSGPLAATEFGGPDSSAGIPYTETRQAEELPQRFELSLAAGVDRIFWSFLRDLDIENDHLAQTLGLMALDWRKKPAYFVYQNLIASAVTSVSAGPVPTEFSLSQNYPNPFNPGTAIPFSLSRLEHVTLKVYDILGREVATLVDEVLLAGDHAVVFEASGLSSGVYFYRITAGQFTQIRKAVLMK